MTVYDQLALLDRRRAQSPQADKIISELRFAARVSAVKEDRFADLIAKAAALLLEEDAISESTAKAAETILLPIAPFAKAYQVHLVAHAHIDMNWMWGYQETAAATADTFRTMLDLLERFPAFRFSQSQASTYQIVAEYLPELLPEIAERIREGRWEIAASTWVENDENLPCGESLLRQQLYTKRYLTALFGEAADCPLDFQPDTFGHCATLPDLCAAGGIRYFYHCRGNDGSESIYRWKGRSGAELLCYCDPYWYTGSIEASLLERVPGICEKYGVNCYLSVYGVGDHGGGPSATDIRKILQMQDWPIMPTLRFSSYREFFAELEQFRDRLPVKTGECNFIFSGCYTSHLETKKQNRIAENCLRESEYLSAFSSLLTGAPGDAPHYSRAWKEILFSQFHDILPGSGVKATTEYASGGYQRAMAECRCRANHALRRLCEQIALDEAFPVGQTESAAGVGAGADMDTMDLSLTGQPGGIRRVFHLFNPTGVPFSGAYPLTVWNREGTGEPIFKTLAGAPIESARTRGKSGYWCGESEQFLLELSIPPFGYTSVLMEERQREALPSIGMFANRQIEYPAPEITLENDLLKAVFARNTMELLSLTEKKTGRQHLQPGSGVFRLALENAAAAGMTAWKEGELLRQEILNESCIVYPEGVDCSSLRQQLRYRLEFACGSRLSVTVALLKGDPVLHYTADIHFTQVGDSRFTPRLDVLFKLCDTPRCFRYDIPFGTIDRPSTRHDLPALHLAAALPEDPSASSAVLLSGGGYGFHGEGNQLSLALLRASHDPDPLPEYGEHQIRFGIGIAESSSPAALQALATRFDHLPISCPARNGKPDPAFPRLAPEGQLLSLAGDGVAITWVKPPEDPSVAGMLLRICCLADAPASFTLRAGFPLREAYRTDLHEKSRVSLPITDGAVCASVQPGEILTLLLC